MAKAGAKARGSHVFLLLAALAALAPFASAQTIPHVSGTFKTPEGKTPTAAGLKAMATIGATPVYGSVDFQPYDAAGNKPTRILCGGFTYIPSRVRAWIKGDGTLVDNYTAAAGVDLVPNTGCTPTGLVTRAFITLSPTPDGRVQSVTWTEDKTLPQQSSIDWGTLAAAGVTAPTYLGYSTIENGGVNVAARSILNFTNGGCVDNAVTLATDCTLSGGGGGGATLQTNSVNNSSQATLNLKSSAATNGLTLTETNTGAGDVQLGLSGTLTPGGGGTGANTNTGAAGKVLIGNGSGQFIEGDPLVQGVVAHDAPGAAIAPVLAGCYANAAAPADVSADVDAVREWCLRNGSQVVNLASGGTLITAGQKAMASSLPVVIASDQSAVPVSGTVTSNIGTTNGLALDATLTGGSAKVQGNVASAASDSGNPLKMGGVFNTTQPTVTNSQRVDFQATARGAQIVATGADTFNVTASGTVTANAGSGTFNIQANASVNETQLNSVALGSPSNYGTSPGAVSVQGVNAFITNVPAVSQSGNWTARVVGNAGGVLDAAGQNASSPANELLMAGQFNTTPTTITSGNVSPLQLDSSGNLKVNIIAGGGTGGGPADVGLSTAASETDAARQKVTSALRLWDQAQGAGSQLVGWRGDTSSGAWVNCKAGCSGAADTVGTGGALNALNATATVALAGDGGVGMFLAAGTLIGTIVPEVSYDGGTTWVASLFYDPAAQTTSASVVFASANPATTRSILAAGGASNARARVSAFTSGTGTATLRATANAGSLAVTQGNAPWGVNLSQYTPVSGRLPVDGSGVTQPVSGTVTSNIGTTNGLALDATLTGGSAKVQGNVASAASDSGNPIKVGGVFNTTQPTVTNAQRVDFQSTARGAQIVATGVDPFSATQGTAAAGTAGWPVTGGNIAQSTAAWTSATSINSAVTVTVTNYNTVIVSLNQGTTLTGGVVTFETSDTTGFTNAYPALGVQLGAIGVTPASTFTLVASTNSAVAINVGGWKAVRVRLSTAITGSGTVNVSVDTQAMPALVHAALVGGTIGANITQFGSSAVVTGTGASGAGIPRMTVANDSSFLGTLADNGVAAATNRLATLPAIARTNLPAAATAGRDGALNTNLHGILRATSLPDTDIPTFHAAKLGLVVAASATDIAVLPGNATNTVVVTRVQLSCTQTTAGIVDVQLIKRSTADTAGTSTAMTTVPLDSGNSAAVSAPLSYTANPTTGTLVGALFPMKVGMLAPGTAGANDVYIWTPKFGQSIVLRGTAQQLALNLNGVTVTGGSCDASFDWIETTGL